MINNKDTLVQTPRTLPKILPRQHIEKLLDEVSLSEVICMIAPYGFGKTFATLSWVINRNRQAIWITLEENVISNLAFIDYVKDSIKQQANIQGKNDINLNVLPDDDHNVVLNNIASCILNGSICIDTIIIDNFHLSKNIELLRFIRDFIFLFIGKLRVIIISRTELPPVYNDLILKKHICLIDIKNFGFNPKEVFEYFNINGCNASSQQVEHIYDSTNGWPAALNAIITISRGGQVIYNEDARSYIKDFFETRIWNGLNEETKEFLLKTSILEKLNPSSCRELTEISATTPILKWLFEHGFFVSRLPEEDNYRYHRVFKDYLYDKLNSSNIDVRSLNIKAAWWLFERKNYEQAFKHFYEANDYYGLSQVLRIITPAENSSMDKYIALVECITLLDHEKLKSYPLIVARMALVHFLKGNINEMQKLYGTFLEWTEPGELPISAEDYAEYLWEAGWLSYINPEEKVLSNKKHEEWSNYREYLPYLRPLHLYRYSVLRFPSALRGIRDYCSVVDSIDSFIEWNSETSYSSIRDEYALYEMDLIRAEYAYEIENYAKAEQIIRNVMASVENKNITSLYFACTVLLVKLARVIHNPKEIDSLINRLGTMIINNHETYLMPNFHAFQLVIMLSNGHIGFTPEFEDDNRECIDKAYFYLLYRQMTYVRGLLSMDRFNESILILSKLDILCNQYKRTMDLIEVNILMSVAYYGLHNEDSASNYLLKALEDARKYGFLRIFSDDARAICPILDLIKKPMRDSYMSKVIISCKKMLSRSEIRYSEKPDKLTKTELNILQALKDGMSYNEIALDKGIKISTVKSHVYSIYSKLHVENRTSAIIKADNEGLFS